MKLDASRQDLNRALDDLAGRQPVLILCDPRGVPASPRPGRDRVRYPGEAPTTLVPGEIEKLEHLERAGRLVLQRPFMPSIGGRRGEA